MKNIKTFENFNNQDILEYIEKNDIKSVKNYIESGYDLNSQNSDGITPLIKSVINDKIEIVKLLLNAGADIDKQDNFGRTALIYATFYNSTMIIKLLLDAGANIDKQDNYGNSALICASESEDNIEMIELLLDYGADEFILNDNDESFYDLLDDENKQYFIHKYPTSVYNAMSHWYKKPFSEFVKEYNIKN